MSDIVTNYITLHAKNLKGETEYFTLTNNDGEWENFINQYFILHELMGRLKLYEEVKKENGIERYVIYKRPLITVSFINNSKERKEKIKISIIFGKNNIKILNNIATITSSDDDDDYDISLRDFIENCIRNKIYDIDSFIHIEEIENNQIEFVATISE